MLNRPQLFAIICVACLTISAIFQIVSVCLLLKIVNGTQRVWVSGGESYVTVDGTVVVDVKNDELVVRVDDEVQVVTPRGKSLTVEPLLGSVQGVHIVNPK